MEGRCNILTCLSVIYSMFLWTQTSESFTSLTGYTFEILMFQCLFVLLFTYEGQSFKDQSKYRPLVDPNLMCVFLVPLCLINDVLTMGSKGDSSARYEDVELSLGVMAVIITKYFFILGKNKVVTIAALSATVGYLLVFASLSTIFLFIISSLVIWKSLYWIPKAAPGSFSFGEMSVCVQMGLCFMVRIIRELAQIRTVEEDELRLKWIGTTAVVAILAATTIIWAMKAYLSVLSVPSFLGVYAVFAVFSAGFLTWVTQENLLLWFWGMLAGNCTLVALLFSWLLFCGITAVWTVSQALQLSIWEKTKNKTVDEPQYMPEQQDTSEDNLETYRRRRKVEVPEGDGTEQSSCSETRSRRSNGISLNTRKVFHVFILLVYVPGLLIAPHILFLASCLAFGVFVVVEAARVLKVPGIGPHLDSILRTFVDERDSGTLFLTHFYLLVGLSLPLWITNSSLAAMSPLKLYSGVLSLGIGDTVACVAGRAFGRLKWSRTIKTVEGTVSSILAQLLFVVIGTYLDCFPPYSQVIVFLGVTHSALYETFTDQIDNLMLPLALYPFLCFG